MKICHPCRVWSNAEELLLWQVWANMRHIGTNRPSEINSEFLNSDHFFHSHNQSRFMIWLWLIHGMANFTANEKVWWQIFMRCLLIGQTIRCDVTVVCYHNVKIKENLLCHNRMMSQWMTRYYIIHVNRDMSWSLVIGFIFGVACSCSNNKYRLMYELAGWILCHNIGSDCITPWKLHKIVNQFNNWQTTAKHCKIHCSVLLGLCSLSIEFNSH